MQVILQVQSGPLTGQVIRIEPGRSVRVGRTPLADLVIADDRRMSGIHFVLEIDETGCVLRDLGSSNGTLVNGCRVNSARLANGDMVVAGETTFSVQIIDERPKPPKPATVTPVPSTPQEKLIAMLRGEFQPLYGLLDAACEPSVLKVLFESKEQYQSLFEGAQGAQLAHFAPYLVRLPEKSPLVETLVQQGWGKNWGVFVTSNETLDGLRHHFRHFLTVRLPNRKQAYFRFYDPRVLRLFLPTCTAEEINLIFGPIRYYVMEDEKPDELLRFSNKGRGVGRRIVPLGPAGEMAAPEAMSGSRSRPDFPPAR
jgi:pSer/pThr/pTyr-binding forkhead associated (FHA) protein